MINDEILYLNKNGDKFPIKICKEKLLTNNIYWSFTTVALANSLDADDLHHSFREQYSLPEIHQTRKRICCSLIF